MDDRYTLEAFFDGDCPLCRREVNLLRRLDHHNKIMFTDIAAPEFNAVEYGKSQQQLMDEMHGRLANGEWVTGVEVFRRFYQAIGFGWLVRPTRLPVASHVLELGYRVFARYRLKLTGRCDAPGASCEIAPDTAK